MIVRRAFVGLLLVVGFLLLLEFTARLIILPAGTVFSYKKLQCNQNHIVSSDLAQPSSLEGVAYELRPNVQSCFKGGRFTTNALGMRDTNYQIEKPENIFRIAVIGSSWAMGSEVGDNESYPEYLERKLNAEKPEKTVEVLNFGVEDHGLCDMVGILKRRALSFSPDAIIVELTKHTTRIACDTRLSDGASLNHVENAAFRPYLWYSLTKWLRIRLLGFGRPYRRWLDQDAERVQNITKAYATIKELQPHYKFSVFSPGSKTPRRKSGVLEHLVLESFVLGIAGNENHNDGEDRIDQ
ncbi:MAG TPA: hypothetical protein VGL70_19380 [Candidatus Binatia bacterium]|jgi:hypothetical protein